MKLTKVEVHKYKSFSEKQEFEVDKNITILVGMNESGKTSALEVIAKTNYFQEDSAFKFSLSHDYPRREKKKVGKTGETPEAITCFYEFDDKLLGEIEADLGKGVINSKDFSVTTNYSNGNSWSIGTIDKKKFIAHKTTELGISSNSINEKLEKVKSIEELKALKTEYTGNNNF